jgi:uncharacterized protein YndB with AHSA1/START domain
MSTTLDIEREMFIAASPETAFKFFVEPVSMAQWFGVRHTLEPRPGGIFRVEVSGGAVARGIYQEVVPYRRVAFTWGWEGRDDLPPGRSLVEIELEARDGGTLVRLRHSGLPTAAGAAFTPEDHGTRWSHYLAQLREQCAPQGAEQRRTS